MQVCHVSLHKIKQYELCKCNWLLKRRLCQGRSQGNVPEDYVKGMKFSWFMFLKFFLGNILFVEWFKPFYSLKKILNWHTALPCIFFVSHQQSFCPFSPHLQMTSLVFFFSSCLLDSSWAFFYSYICYPYCTHAQTISIWPLYLSDGLISNTVCIHVTHKQNLNIFNSATSSSSTFGQCRFSKSNNIAGITTLL